MSNLSSLDKSSVHITRDELLSNWRTMDLVVLNDDIVDPRLLSDYSTLNFIPIRQYAAEGGAAAAASKRGPGHADLMRKCRRPMQHCRQMMRDYRVLDRIPWQLSMIAVKVLRVCGLMVNVMMPDMVRADENMKRNLQRINSIRERCHREYMRRAANEQYTY